MDEFDGSPEDMNMIVVMGVTGSGKSHFINTLVKDAVVESRQMTSVTQNCQLVETMIGETPVAIVDTPGFDDTYRSDAEIFSLITKYLVLQDKLGYSLKGIIYLHRITDPRMQGTALRNFQMFQKICGDEALGNVILVTTMWDNLKDELHGLQRDQELRRDFWSMMEQKGSRIARFDGQKGEIVALLAHLLGKESVVLKIQREMRDDGKRLEETAAGRLLVPDLEAEVRRNEDHLKYLEGEAVKAQKDRDYTRMKELEKECKKYRKQLDKEEKARRKMKAKIGRETEEDIQRETSRFTVKDGLQIFVSLTGVTLTVIFNLLPLLGVCTIC